MRLQENYCNLNKSVDDLHRKYFSFLTSRLPILQLYNDLKFGIDRMASHFPFVKGIKKKQSFLNSRS